MQNKETKTEEKSTSQASANAEEPVETAGVNSDDCQDICEPGAVRPPRITRISTRSKIRVTSVEGRSQSQDTRCYEEFVSEEADLEYDGQREWNSHSDLNAADDAKTARIKAPNVVPRTGKFTV